MPTYGDVQQAVMSTMPGPTLPPYADRIIAAIRDVFMRAGVRDGTAILDAMIPPGSDPTNGGAV